MRSIAVAAITLALAIPVLPRPGSAGELLPGGWLMPPRIQQASPMPIAPAPSPPPAAARPKPPPQPRPASPPPAQRQPPSDGKVQF